ncbi:MAG: hypothetical protein LBS93_05305, partial [Synergistaceae bacterium]|nr:hypothetical protein [Synergistaceae bacterium]
MTETEKSFRRFTPLAALLLALALTILFAPSAVAAVSRFEILPRLDSNDLKFKEVTTVSPGISFNVRIADESDRDDLNYIKIASVDVALTTTGAVEGSQTVGGITVTADIVDPSYQATVTFSGIAGVWQDEPYRLQVLGYDIGDNLIASEDITIRLYRYSAQAGPAVIPINLAAPQTPRVYPIKFLKHVSGKSATEATDFPDGSIFEFSDAPAPGDKTAWNGLEISAFGKEIQISGRP